MKKFSPLFTRGLAVSCRWVSCAALLAAIHASSAQSSDMVRFTVRQVPVPAAPFGVKAADFNGDGKQDLALRTFNSGVEIYLGSGTGKFSKPTEYPYPDGADGSDLTIGDFDGDGSPDLAVCTFPPNTPGGDVAVYFNNGHGEFSPPTLLPIAGGQAEGAAGDFNRDGNLDLAVVSGVTVSVFLGDGAGGFATPIVFSTDGKSSQDIVAGDFDGDGILDLAITDYEYLCVGIFHGNGDGSFSGGRFYNVGGNPTGLATGDFNRDGKADVAVADDISGMPVAIFLGNGDGTLTREADLPLSTNGAIAIGDFNGDGNPDIVTDTSSEPSALKIALGDGTGNFGIVQTISYPTGTGEVFDLAAADFNGDGKLDLASAQGTAADDGTFNSLIFLNHSQRSRRRH